VTALAPNVSLADGTSFSAPAVTGIAGLLLSQVDTLSAVTLRQLIIDGANASGRVAGGFPIVDARKSLELLSARMRSPLCGNRVWSEPGSIVIQRGAQQERVTIPQHTWVSEITVHHGGRTIEYSYLDTDTSVWLLGAVRHTASGWTSGSPGADTMTLSGSTQGSIGFDHDGKRFAFSTVIVDPDGIVVPADSERVVVTIRDSLGNDVAQFMRDYPIGPTGRQGGCAITRPAPSPCDPYDHPPTAGLLSVVPTAFSSVDSTIWLAVNRRSAVVNPDSSYTFIDSNNVVNTVFPERYVWTPLGADLYSVDLADPLASPVLRLTIQNSYVYGLAVSEDGRELMMAVGDESLTERFSGHRGADFGVGGRQQGACSVTFRSIAALNVVAASGTASTACPPFSRIDRGAGGGFGARRPGKRSVLPLIAR